jgi:type VI secretion system VasD/TssJ family lipoprotein
MIRASAMLVGVVFAAVSCSGVSSYRLGLRGSPDLNPNEDNQPNPVQVKVLQLKGEEAAKAFGTAPFDELWEKPASVPGIAVHGAVQSTYVQAKTDQVTLTISDVPPEVTHIGLLALFNKADTGKERLVMPRDQIDDADIWLVASMLGAPDPTKKN